MSGETAAIGIGFLLGGPIGAIIGGTVAPAALAALMWRSRNSEHDANSNDTRNGASGHSGSGGGGNNTAGRGRNNGGGSGGGRNNSAGGRHHSPNRSGGGTGGGAGLGGGKDRKPKVKDPIADKLGKLTKGLGDKIKRNKDDKAPKGDKNGKGPTANTDGRKVKNRGPQPDSDRPWRGRGHKDKPEKAKNDKRRKTSNDDDTSSTTAPDGHDPKGPKGGTDPIDDRITLVRAKRERDQRRRAIKEGKKAAEQAARDQTLGDPYQVKLEVIREHNWRIDLELQQQKERLALTAAAEKPRSTPVNYPAIQAAPTGTHTAGTAIARQIDFRGSTAYAILRAMADQLAHGLHRDADADMADHIVELTGIPNMCKNLSIAVQEAARALARTAPLHPSVIKHLNNAAIAARTAGAMADNIMVVFVQAHREDIIRVLDPRIGEERWNLRNGPGTLDAAKLRAAIASAHSARLALPAGGTTNNSGGSKLVPASDGSTKKLINLMKDFTHGHMVNVLSEVAGAAAGVETVADSVTKLYRRMANTWPTEGVVDDTVRATASKVRTVATELKKAILAAQRAHQRELRLNAKPRKNARAESKWDVAGRRGPSN
ncbi:hypothetical protein ACFZAR_36085 [Streptomyces sp. NPDC008222]|uniref:hypothetical protein n=1 Tax=Streptomyces sp. NPDC008222 TaxID=3364820 RepID=UPI0036E1C1F6